MLVAVVVTLAEVVAAMTSIALVGAVVVAVAVLVLVTF